MDERVGKLSEENSGSIIEHETFGAFFDRMLPRALRTASRLLGTRSDAEDAVVEAFGRAFAKWDYLGTAQHRDAWLLRVAANVAYDELRKATLEARRSEPAVPPPDAFDSVDLRLTFVPVLRKLTRRQREAVVLTHVAGLPRKEVADLLGCSEESVKTHLRRGLRRLRANLGDDANTVGADDE